MSVTKMERCTNKRQKGMLLTEKVSGAVVKVAAPETFVPPYPTFSLF